MYMAAGVLTCCNSVTMMTVREDERVILNVDKQELGKIINPLDAAMPQPKAK